MKGWFDAFRDDGGPTLYSFSNRTPVTGDVSIVAVSVLFATFYVAFLVIFPGVRKQKFTTFSTVTLSLFVGLVILITRLGSAWHVAHATIIAPYKAFSREKLPARIGTHIGLMHVNVTLTAIPIGNWTPPDIDYNERFTWEGANDMSANYRHALQRGLPFPILTVAEYFSLGREGFSWGGQYRAAGYFASIMLWASLASWLLMNLLLIAVPRYGAYMKALTGALLVCTTVGYHCLLPKRPLSIHLEGGRLEFHFGWCYWLVLVAGILCFIAGVLISIIDLVWPHTFSTVLEVYYGTPYDRHVILEESSDVRYRKPRNSRSLEDPPGLGSRILRRLSSRHVICNLARHRVAIVLPECPAAVVWKTRASSRMHQRVLGDIPSEGRSNWRSSSTRIHCISIRCSSTISTTSTTISSSCSSWAVRWCSIPCIICSAPCRRILDPALLRQPCKSPRCTSTLWRGCCLKTKDIDSVEGKSVSLPCPITEPLDNVYMVLWFRDNAGIPLYSFDVRDKESREQPRHWSAPEVFGSRAKFHFDSQPATLEIKDIKRHDQGIYRCRVDFRTSQTQSFRFNLSVIILPEQPIILDRWGRQLNGTQLGPKQEGDDIVITCRVVGGRPQPQVRWLVNGLLVDNQNEHNSGDVIENRLLWPSVQRNDLNSVFTCQALNTQLDKPKEKSFILDMHLKPLVVKILEPPSSMIADRRYEVSCESSGSRPNAIITWYKGKRQLRRTKDDISKNSTRSELSFVPTTDDDGKSITCRAENPNVNGLYLETMWKLNVVYPPLVTLRLGSTLTPDDIKEGDDVYFECHVQSNPQWRKLLWLHNGIHLEHNTSARVIRSNQSLVLQKITKHYAGNYACSAINDEGETVSNQLPLRVKYTPMCKHADRVILIGASKDETVEVVCEIQADPPPRTFRWKFNNSGETLDVGSERFSVNGSRSILKYTPVTDQDYGTLSCWASNEVGTQQHPCLFQVVLAALPNAVSNCTVFNRTELSVDIQCIPGYDGGLPQIFVLEMFSTRTGITRFNLSNAEEALFSLENLDTLTSMMVQENNSLRLRIYSYNQKGRSAAYLLPDFIIGSTAYKTDDDVTLTLSPVIVGSVLTIIIIGVAIAIRIFVVTFVHNLRRNRHHGSKATAAGVTAQPSDVFKGGNLEKPRWQHTDIKTKSSEDLVEDERDPDVIPSQYVGGSSAGSSGSNASNVGSTTAGTATGSSTSTAVVANANAAASAMSGPGGATSSASATDGHQCASATAAAGGGASKWSPNGNVST
ncbi:GM14610 [Drosophila sechellia]|uniref:GM14610 n=1 Tax=Drosophila sechellia TaxID=7238 RepID=B4HXK7_DROSE|nr:GM14610 [Drosophila sechellia]